MENTELAWAAGFFDGEGHVGLHSRKRNGRRYFHVGLTITQTEKAPLDRFRQAVGVGNIYGPSGTARQRHGHKQIFYYNVTGLRRCQAVRNLIWPFLCEIKRQQFTKTLTKAAEIANRPWGQRGEML